MTRTSAALGLPFLAGLACVAVLAGGPAQAGETTVVASAAAQPAAPPPLALSQRVLEAASLFRAYMRRATSIGADFKSGQQVEEGLLAGESYEPQQLSKGAIAYAALIALQEPTFVAGVRSYGVNADTRRQIVERLLSDPSYAAAFPGAAAAAGAIQATLAAEAQKLHVSGHAVKMSAYSVQHQAWSKGKIINPAQRMSLAKSVSAAPMAPAAAEAEALRAAVTGAAQLEVVRGPDLPGPYTPLVSRALAIAALSALGQAGDDQDANIQTLLAEATDGFCLNMAKLNLYQCLAVAGPWYEDVFCLGEHVLMDTAQCVAKSAGAPPLEAPLTRAAFASAAPAEREPRKSRVRSR